MPQLNILITGSHPEILATIERLINNNPLWRAVCALTAEAALDNLQHGAIDLVLLGAGLSAAEEQQLIEICQSAGRVIPVTRHYGGGSGLLFAEIELAIGGKD